MLFLALSAKVSGPKVQNTMFHITEKAGHHFLVVIGQHPSPCKQLDVMSSSTSLSLSPKSFKRALKDILTP